MYVYNCIYIIFFYNINNNTTQIINYINNCSFIYILFINIFTFSNIYI